MKSFSSNTLFFIANKWRVSTLANTFVITFRICSVIGILPWIVLTFFFRDNEKILIVIIALLKAQSVPYFIHTLQLLIKNSLFKDNRLKFLLAKIRKTVCHFSHSSKASKILKILQVYFDHVQTKQKPLLLVQDVDTRCNLTYLILERLIKLKLSVRYYKATIKYRIIHLKD